MRVFTSCRASTPCLHCPAAQQETSFLRKLALPERRSHLHEKSHISRCVLMTLWTSIPLRPLRSSDQSPSPVPVSVLRTWGDCLTRVPDCGRVWVTLTFLCFCVRRASGFCFVSFWMLILLISYLLCCYFKHIWTQVLKGHLKLTWKVKRCHIGRSNLLKMRIKVYLISS